MQSDIEIAREAELRPIRSIAEQLGLSHDEIIPYGHYKAKIPLDVINRRDSEPGSLVLVTGISPTPAGEGKSTLSVGLADALRRRGRNAVKSIRMSESNPSNMEASFS